MTTTPPTPLARLLAFGRAHWKLSAGAGIGLTAGTAALLTLGGAALTPVTWNCETCAAGPAQVCATAYNMLDPDNHRTCVNVTFPIEGNLLTIEMALPAADYRVDASVDHVDPATPDTYGLTQTVTGLGDPLPTPEPTPTVTSTPTPTGTVTPTPTTPPAGTASPNCTIVTVAEGLPHTAPDVALVYPADRRWTISWGWVLINGEYAMPGQGHLMGAQGQALAIIDGQVYIREAREAQLWYRWVDYNNVVEVGTALPPCGTVTPTPTVPPTPTVTPTPTPPPPVIVTATVTGRTCAALLAAPKPATALGTGWRVQYFAGTTSLTTAYYTIARIVTLPAKVNDNLRAEWTKDTVRIVQQLAPITCEVR
jgi:hypothetical protein